MNNTVNIPIKASVDYDVVIGRNILDTVGKRVNELKGNCNIVIITDNIVNGLYGKKVSENLTENGFNHYIYEFENGEKSKNIENFGNICEFLAENNINRNDLIIALGGGVVGDISGFVAASYLRGIDYMQVPTTFLAAIDSSVGGKTAIDLKAGKNLVGAFKQPIEVICDVETFKTLEDKVFADGVAEAIKYGVLFDKELFNRFLKSEVNSESDDISEIVSKCVKHKRDIVANDEFDRGERQLLNLGHTFGHAIERCSDYEITHGHGVAVGMAIIARATEKKNLNDEPVAKIIEEVLVKNNLPINTEFSTKDLFEKTLRDKKVMGSKISLIIPKRIGKCILHKVEVEEVEEFIELGKGN